MKCAGCGKESDVPLCIDCKIKTLELKEIELKACMMCKKVQSNNRWYPSLEPALAKKVRQHGKVSDINIEEFKPGKRSTGTATLKKGDEMYRIEFFVDGTYCEDCRKKQGDYFEAIIQIRNERDDITKTLQSCMRRKDLYCSKEVKKDSGTDYFVHDTQLAVQCVKELHKKYGGKVAISKKIHGKDRQTSKHTYRVTVLFSALPFKKNDVIALGNEPVVIESVGKNIRGRSLLRKRSMQIDADDHTILKKYNTKISKVRPQIEIFDPKTYQSVPVKNKKDIQLGEKVKVVKLNNLYYLV